IEVGWACYWIGVFKRCIDHPHIYQQTFGPRAGIGDFVVNVPAAANERDTRLWLRPRWRGGLFLVLRIIWIVLRSCRVLLHGGNKRLEQDVRAKVVVFREDIVLKNGRLARQWRDCFAIADHDQIQAGHDEEELITRSGAPVSVARDASVAA